MSLAAFGLIPASGNPIDDFVAADVHFEVPQKDLIANVAAVRASCNLTASGEPLTVLANGSVRSTLAASPGPCTIVLVLVGNDIALPVFNTTPLGRNSFYLPGISTVSLGIVDLSVDLVTSLNSTSRVEDGIADVVPREIAWSTWGAERILVHGEDGLGSGVDSSLNTTFTYRMSLALTVYGFSIELYHVDLAEIGSVAGTPSLRTAVAVDLRPHGLVLGPAEDIRSDGATISWSGTVDADVDHLELWLVDPSGNVTVHLAPTVTRVDVLLRPLTAYQAWIVAVDRAGQATSSNRIAFESLASPVDGGSSVGGLGTSAFAWTMVALAVLAGIVGYAIGFLRGRKRE